MPQPDFDPMVLPAFAFATDAETPTEGIGESGGKDAAPVGDDARTSENGTKCGVEHAEKRAVRLQGLPLPLHS
jgi:hypothetical protein